MATGMDAGQAEATAVAAFGKPNRWALDIVDATFADQHTRLGRRWAFAFGVCALVLPLINFQPHEGDTFPKPGS